MTTAANWFPVASDFMTLCADAQSQALSYSAQEFANDMVVRAKEHGLNTYLSEKQLHYLCTLADWSVPERLTPAVKEAEQHG